ncbi:MAG TPA: cytochrome c oxidase subunit I [Longimicrobiales bacterium]|nr:cytochrome c oxidase subunit I [Longimicrobiales bacterium]
MASAEATLRAAPAAARSGAENTLWSWMTTVDHKRIGILYAVTSFFFLLVGGFEALLIRIQLAQPEMTFLSPEAYNQIFTMHGITMVFLVGMPIGVALFNYLVPLQIGARDVAFPRLNALSYWIFLLGGLFINAGFLFGSAPNVGWTGYATLTSREFSPGLHADFYSLGLQILGLASIMGGVNFVTTIINLRAPGMRLMRMPLFTWMAFVTSFLLLTALPVLAVALFYLSFDRFFGTGFFLPQIGGDPILWQHLFWIFGHPEVYILILPGFGIVSEVIPTFAKKPLFGYAIMVYSGILIAFLGWGVWSHHMFTVGLGPIADSFFVIATMIIAIPTGVKIFNWLATLWGGDIQFTTSMKFAAAFIAMFTMGGVSGIMHSAAPGDLQQHDTYFVVAHFHYVLFGGLLLAIFSGLYYWFPKVTGRFLNEKLGTLNFWLMFIGFNLTFFPMHLSGLLGMPRRIVTYSAELNLGWLNMLTTIGAFIIAIGTIVTIYNVVRSLKHGERASANPWGAATLEWSIPSPPPSYNFDVLPEVRSRLPLWDDPSMVKEHLPAELPEGVHMPSNSYWPIVVAVGITLCCALLLVTNMWWPPLLGLLVAAIGVINWAFEPQFK